MDAGQPRQRRKLRLPLPHGLVYTKALQRALQRCAGHRGQHCGGASGQVGLHGPNKGSLFPIPEIGPRAPVDVQVYKARREILSFCVDHSRKRLLRRNAAPICCDFSLPAD